MAAGSVIVDLAAETGGNCELTVKGEIVERHGVTIIGTLNLPSTIPVHASQMYSKNVQNLLALMIDSNGNFNLNLEDDIVAGTIISHEGQLLHEERSPGCSRSLLRKLLQPTKLLGSHLTFPQWLLSGRTPLRCPPPSDSIDRRI